MAERPSPEQLERLHAAGYMAWAADLSGRSYVHPDGLRIVSLEQAVAELDAKEKQTSEAA